MSLFSKPNAFEEIVNSATDENLTTENWEVILTVCDKVSHGSPENARDCIAAIQKHEKKKWLTDALVKNCNISAHREISSRAFTDTLVKLIRDRTTHDQVRKKALELIQTCSFEFRADSSLGLMNDVYHSLRAEGIQFPNPQKPKKEFSQSELDKQKEEEEFQLALALSLSESENRSSYRASSTTNNAPKANTTATTTTNTNTSSAPAEVPEEPKVSRVRALYDFQPTEQGELGFQKGDVIRVIESVYRDWWKGDLRGKTGIFPVNYVEKIVDPTPTDLVKEAEMEAEVLGEIRNVERLLDILSNTDPRKDAFSENEELQNLYNSSLAIRPKLVRLIEKYSLKKDELVALNEKFLQARVTYDRMLNESIARYSAPGAPGANAPTYGGYNAPTPDNYQAYGSQPYQYQQQPSQQQQQPQQIPPQPSPAVSNGNINYNGYNNVPVENYQAQPQQTPTSVPNAGTPTYSGYGMPTENYQTYESQQPYPQQHQQHQQQPQYQQTPQQQQQQQPIYSGYGQDTTAPLKF
ncbi:unnamed protein product [Cunninghamella blakesleeana]